ncbi:MAG: hypothetical protein KDJ52_05860 [Anaerolineae bacterium]|nr:hypothetical protein [Anaerolineae bacterium]
MDERLSFDNKTTHCFTKDNVEIRVKYSCSVAIAKNRVFKKHKDHHARSNIGWQDKLQQQINGAITYVLKHYLWFMLQENNSHREHIERQIINCLNENYYDETTPLFDKGLAIQSVELLQVTERPKLY